MDAEQVGTSNRASVHLPPQCKTEYWPQQERKHALDGQEATLAKHDGDPQGHNHHLEPSAASVSPPNSHGSQSVDRRKDPIEQGRAHIQTERVWNARRT